MDARPTDYHGITMRSRLEADFARYLDSLSVQWVYEPEVFGPVGGGYLPDFRIDRPDGSDYIEVKPTVAEVPLAKARMEIIWQTRPDAALVVVCAEGSRFYGSVAGGEWTMWRSLWKHE